MRGQGMRGMRGVPGRAGACGACGACRGVRGVRGVPGHAGRAALRGAALHGPRLIPGDMPSPWPGERAYRDYVQWLARAEGMSSLEIKDEGAYPVLDAAGPEP